MIRTSLMLLCIALASGCSLQPVNPWQKGNLAKPIMALDPDPLETRFDQHTYFSKEAASGGAGVGGGGCGCN
jgi:Domain of unknown function (DUF4266)